MRSSLSRWANSIVHDKTCLLRTAPHRTLSLAAPVRTPLPRRALPFSQRPCLQNLLPSFAERQTQAAPNPSESISGRRQFARAVHCETVAPSTPPTRTRTRLESPLRSVPACRAPRRARASAAPPRPLRSHRIVYCTHNRQHTPLAAAAAAAALAVRHHSRPGTARSLAAERL